jgi:hypothetical protein
MVIIAHYALEEDAQRGVFCSECGIGPVPNLRGSLTACVSSPVSRLRTHPKIESPVTGNGILQPIPFKKSRGHGDVDRTVTGLESRPLVNSGGCAVS